MPANSSEPKTFDAITILGIIAAVAIMVFGQMHMSKKRDEAIAIANKERADQEERDRVAAARAAAEDARKAEAAKKDPTPGPGPGPEAPKKAEPTPDITVQSDWLELVFCSKGAALKSARLPGKTVLPDGKVFYVDEDAFKKDHKGLDILAEIVSGKRTFGIPRFEIGPRSGTRLIIDEKSTDALDESIWSPKDSGSFDANGNRTIAYELTIQNYTLTKTFTILKTERFIKCDLKIENKSDKDVECFYWINGPQGILLDGPAEDPKGAAGARVNVQAELAARAGTDQAYSTGEPDALLQVSPEAAKGDVEENRAVTLRENLWGAVKNRFFMAMFISNEPRQLVKIRADAIRNEHDFPLDKRFSEPNIGVVGIRTTVALGKGAVQNDPYSLYLGPADDASLDLVEAAMQKPAPYYLKSSIKFYDMWGWRWPRVDWLARQMMWVFKGLHKLIGNFGLAVVFLTIMIKLCLHPLQRKMMISMSKMQKLQPELNKIKEKYKNATTTEAKMRMGTEQREVMAKAGVSPAAGCLPMFIQIPIFTALYGIFNHAFEMRGAEFLWIKDLSQPDRLYTFTSTPGASSWIPSAINLLPILYIGLSFIQTRMQPQTKSDDPQQEMNRKMMMFMPIMISFMFYSMPAGLVLYFAVSACWGMLESWFIKKFLINNPPASPGTPDAGKLAAVATR